MSTINKKTVFKKSATVFFTIAGFIIAVITNAFVPQIADGVVIEKYPFASAKLDMNEAYRIVLFALIIF